MEILSVTFTTPPGYRRLFSVAPSFPSYERSTLILRSENEKFRFGNLLSFRFKPIEFG